MVTNEQRFKDLIKAGKTDSFILAMAVERLEQAVINIVETGLPELKRQMEVDGSSKMISPELWFDTASRINFIMSLDQ